jgi:glycine/D-amino acid oxidase-like deaminating enzyme
MLGTDIGSTDWPTCGEIDVMENIGREPTIVHGTMHGPGYSGGSGIGQSFTFATPVADDYHVFAVEWTPGEVRWLVDEKEYQRVTPADLPSGARWVFDHPFFLLLNVAVGGGWPGDPNLDVGRATARAASVTGSAGTVADVFPAARKASVLRAWVGIEPQSIDGLAIVGPTPGVEGLYVATGFSGHGFALGPGIGKLLAQQMTTGQTELSLDALGLERFADRDPVEIDRFVQGGFETEKSGTLG